MSFDRHELWWDMNFDGRYIRGNAILSGSTVNDIGLRVNSAGVSSSPVLTSTIADKFRVLSLAFLSCLRYKFGLNFSI